jgi:hypothetical protein
LMVQNRRWPIRVIGLSCVSTVTEFGSGPILSALELSAAIQQGLKTDRPRCVQTYSGPRYTRRAMDITIRLLGLVHSQISDAVQK